MISLLCAALLLTTTLSSASPIIDLGYSQYQGAVNVYTNVTTFLGIRYAAAPIDDLRFRAPQTPKHVAGVQQATELPDTCPQTGIGSSSTNPNRARGIVVGSSEDCLTLSVSYPSDGQGAPEGPLPVIVWIYGGGYTQGFTAMYRGTDITAQSNRGAVVVVVQYRLGLFGFLQGTAVKKGGALNAGLLDQDFALRWVNKHISKFGGDASKVTIWGESAGAGSVLQHVVANGGKTKPPLFRAAMTSSVFLPPQYNYNDRIPELLYSKVVEQTNCTAAADSLSCLRATDFDVLQTINLALNNAAFYGTSTFYPVVDGEFIRERPSVALSQAKVNGKALLAVTNAFEGAALVDPNIVNATNFVFELFPKLDASDAARAGALYAGLGTQIFQGSAILAESHFICPSYSLLRAFPGRSFKAEFAIPPAIHGMDVLAYFPSIATDVPELAAAFGGAVYETVNPALIDAFAQTFTSFAISSDPNVKVDPASITPTWNRWRVGQTEMVFNATESGSPAVKLVKTDGALLKRCQFWDSVASKTSQ
ncbi:Alpha/Beta hydrolase protein [Mycena crocata]|nr:Alpha/Beta hydrolase protein [Mycena crocata]